MLDVEKLLQDVFSPEAGELVTFVVDSPREGIEDSDAWMERRAMAAEWRDAMARIGERIGFEVRPLLTYPATGANNGDLPAEASVGGESVPLEETLLSSTLVIAMTTYSATAPLAMLAEKNEDFRAASMPGVVRRMEKSALAADYAEVARRCRAIYDLMQGCLMADVLFSTGHRCFFDLRHRSAEMDDGSLPRHKPGDRIINLPSGETFCVPYEGEREGEPSWTAGTIPVVDQNELVLFHVAGNRIVEIEGEGQEAARRRVFFEADPARANIAELAFGVNESAAVWGNVLEDEKAGFHWAYGRSDHLGGVVGVGTFASPETVVHTDIVYAKGNPVQVHRATLVHPDEGERVVIEDGQYTI